MNFFSFMDCLEVLTFLVLVFIIIKISKENKSIKKDNEDNFFKFIHEVKNPLSVALGYIEIMDRKEKIEKEKYIPIIKKEIKDSVNIINDYLSYRKLLVNLEYIDINMLIKEVIEDFKKLQELYNFNINFYYDEEELIVYGDYIKLKQVFVNLIKNSIESSNSKRVEIDIDYKVIKNMFLIEISDNGNGIESLNVLGKNNYTSKKDGNGLGIVFSKKIIELHNGKLKYSSKENKGTDVKVFIPCVNL